MESLSSTKYIQKHYLCRGHKIFSKYVEKGAPTVVFETGLGDDSGSWDYVQNQVSKLTSTFSYDRAGIGKSDKAPTPRTCLDIVYDLVDLLSKAPVEYPYILVGHSFGGLVIRLFASMYPELVLGIILVDAAPEYKEISYEKILPEKNILPNREYLNNPMLNSEKIDKIQSYDQISSNKYLYDIPLTVIIRGLSDVFDQDLPNERILEIDQELQLNFLKLSTKSKVVIAKNSTHFIQNDEPEIIIEEIKKMLSIFK
ncbi:alpha/beta hydrolase [Clostridium gasigenes]|uniref:alpha/beta fold hydrolase n=1 Tax=Clostridium gasigenes TaxID=94869 RepID=UPI001C0E4C7D|nr:alpha/beta hydrolase [Clostridium gasigenes]MBU3135792.1 alpha/beta hydrolase [Clostridium gasigenes]